MESASWQGETTSYDPEQRHSASFVEKTVKSQTSTQSPKTPKQLAVSLECCGYYFFVLVGILILLTYVFLVTFWFVINVRDSRVDNVRQGEESQCTSFPDIFLSFFIIMGIFVPFSCFVAWLDPDSQCYTLMEFMKIIIAALWLAIMFWGVDEYFHIEPDCETYMKKVGGMDFWLACESFAYAMVGAFILLALFCFCSIHQACEQSRIEREFRNSYYRQIHT